MGSVKDWWITWAPYWEYLEDRHFSTSITEKLLSEISSPVLVVGAGQGLIVNYLKNKGYKVDGLDLEDEMIRLAKKRHSINLIKGDARNLPFENKSYKTVILSSGVVDYGTDKKSIKKIIEEALRVVSPQGNLLIAFYQIDKKIEKIYKKIGVIDKEKNYYNKRIFDIDRISKKNPLKCVLPIMQWTNHGFFRTMVYWTKLGITLPKELKEERKKVEVVFDLAKENNVTYEMLYESIPDKLPYRELSDVENLMDELGFSYNEIERFNDCIVVKFYKSGLLNIKKKNEKSAVKDWIINIKDLKKSYKGSEKNAVDSLNISIKKGSIFGLLGPNGAGKTTTLSILCGLLKPTSGEILFSNKIDKKNIQKAIGFVPQELALYHNLTARENMAFFGKLYDVRGKHLQKKIDELLKRVGLMDRADDMIRKYSTGMKRRLNFAIGIINDPEIILLDEPTVGIDPQSRNHIFDLIHELNKNGKTIIYTTHYMEEADKLCDEIAIMDRSKIIIQGNPGELVEKYGRASINFNTGVKCPDAFIQKLLNMNDVIDAKVSKNNLSIIISNVKDNIKLIEGIDKISKKDKVKLSLKDISSPNLETLFLDMTGRNLRDSMEEESIG